jgi:hypothetical protein
MQQVTAILELRYEELPNVYAYKRKLLNALGADKAPQATLIENIDFRITEEKAKVLIEPNRTAMSIEQAKPDVSLAFFLKLYERLDNLIHYSKVKQIGYRGVFAERSDKTFGTLLKEYKAAFFTDNPLLKDAIDVGVPLTFEIEDYRVNFISGPMKHDQLNGMIDSDITGKRFLTVDLDFIRNDVTTSRKFIKEFCRDVQEKQKQIIRKWEETMRGGQS